MKRAQQTQRKPGCQAAFFAVALAISAVGSTAQAAPVYSSALAGAYTSYSFGGPGLATWDLSQPWSANVVGSSENGSMPAAATNPGGTFNGAVVSSSASANLATAELKAKADSVLEPGAIASNARATAVSQFGDQFTVLASNGGPYQWSSAATVRFSFDISGVVSGPSLVTSFSLEFGYGLPGALAANGQPHGTSFPAGMVSGGFLIQDQCLFQAGFSESLLGQMTCGGLIGVDALGNVSGSVFAEFAPNGDFDWYAGLTLLGWPGAFGSGAGESHLDFSSTVTVGYTGPQDSITRAGSGAFPGLQVASVPEPGSFALIFTALALIGATRRRQAAKP